MKKINKKALIMLLAVFTYSFSFAQCPVPSGLNAVSNSPSSALLTWTAVPGASLYNVEVQNGKNNPAVFLVKANVVTNSYTVSGMTPGLIYKFKVRTNCGGNKSNWSAYFQFAAGGGGINCVQLTGLTVTGITATGAQFNWNANPGGLGYAVRVEDASGNPVAFLFNANTTTNSYSMTGLNPSSNYKVKVRKRCAPGVNGPWTSWSFFSTTALRDGEMLSGNAGITDIQVYPNPARDLITVSFSDAMNEPVLNFRIYDINGRMISTISNPEMAGSGYVINIGDLSPGLYQLMVQTASDMAISKISILR